MDPANLEVAKSRLLSYILADMDPVQEVEMVEVEKRVSPIKEESAQNSSMPILQQIKKKIRLEKQQKVIFVYLSILIKTVNPRRIRLPQQRPHPSL